MIAQGKTLFKIFVVGIIGMILSMTIVYALPQGRMKENSEKAAIELDKEGDWLRLDQKYAMTQKDNYTDAVMLNMAVQDRDRNDLAIVRAMRSSLTVYKTINDSTTHSFRNAIQNKAGGQEYLYNRYWHGYQILLKPMLELFTYDQILIIGQWVLLVMVFAVIFLMVHKKIHPIIIGGFIISILLLSPVTIVGNIQFTVIPYITLIGLIVLLAFPKINQWDCFFAVGMMVSFFDLLTVPVFSLGILLLFVGLLNKDLEGVVYVKHIIMKSMVWGLGYVLTWASKWGLGTLITGENIFKSAFLNSKVRLSSVDATGQSISYKDWINRFSIIYGIDYGKIILIVMSILLIIGIIVGIYTRNKNMIPVLIIATIPFVWYFILKNHSYIHLWFTFRNLGITYFAMFVLLGQGVEKARRSTVGNMRRR